MNLSLENLTFKYGRLKAPVLRDVSITLSDTGVVGLLGPNGAGKSTLLYLISGLLTPSKGEVKYNGVSTRKRQPSVMADIYLVAEEPTLPRMSLENYVKLFSPFYENFNEDVMTDCLMEFNMFSPKNLKALSMGQRKKIVLSFAIACGCPVMLMDEPTNGLDIPGKAAFRRLIVRHTKEEQLIIISTHQVRDLDAILDRVMIMDDHHIVMNESVTRLQQKFRFERGARSVTEDSIYSLPGIGGFDLMRPNEDEEETELNLELLFDAALKRADRLKSILDK